MRGRSACFSNTFYEVSGLHRQGERTLIVGDSVRTVGSSPTFRAISFSCYFECTRVFHAVPSTA